MQRTILHCDCNSFFASVETVRNPSYRNVPMAVCGSVEDRHGIVLAKNELAKRYGIVTAETVASAKRKCPNLVIASPHYEDYVKFSHMVGTIYARYTDMIEPFGIDESWLDVTGSRTLFGDGLTIAERIRREVKEECGITVSIGVSFNKVFAKLGSDYKKPDAITVISEDNFRQIVYPLPVGDLLFVGKHTVEALGSLGIHTIGELACAKDELVRHRLGKMGDMLLSYARGEDTSPVRVDTEPAKSVSNGYTFTRDLVSREECRHAIEILTEEIGTKLRRMRVHCTTVTLKVKDPFLKTYQKQKKLTAPTSITKEIAKAAYDILCLMWEEDRPIRMLTIGASGLIQTDLTAEQITFFEDEALTLRRKRDGLRDEAVDTIRERFGTASIVTASAIHDTLGLFHKERRDAKEQKKNNG